MREKETGGEAGKRGRRGNNWHRPVFPVEKQCEMRRSDGWNNYRKRVGLGEGWVANRQADVYEGKFILKPILQC